MLLDMIGPGLLRLAPTILSYAPIDLRYPITCVQSSALRAKRHIPFKILRRLVNDVAVICDILKYGEVDPAVTELKKRMLEATSLREYEICTNALDALQGHEAWKDEKLSIEPDYNPETIEAHMEALQNAVVAPDVEAIRLLIRTSLSRDLGGMNMLRLYKHSWFGTKRLVDNYTNTAVTTIEEFVHLISDANTPEFEVRISIQALEDALKYFGRSALTLSGGAILGMKHIGIAKCLWESEMLPEIISGASAGSIVAAIIGSSNDEEMHYTLEHFPVSNLAVFDPIDTGYVGWAMNRLWKFVTTGTFFDAAFLETVMKEWLKDITFREAYNKTKRVLNICVSSADTTEPRLLNYITAPDVYIWSAVCASCSVPGVFPAASIYEKDPVTKLPVLWMQSAQQFFVDGSLDHDIPMRKLSEMFNVNFFVVSQVNPHVRLFLSPEEAFNGTQPTRPRSRLGILSSIKEFGRQEIIHRAQQTADLGMPAFTWRWASLLNQQYTGDINILPEIETKEYLSMMMNPTSDFMKRATLLGERATWPKMCRIKNCVAIELALIQAIRDLNERLHFSPQARAARERTRSSSRGRSSRGHSARPEFLRRRSLSSETRKSNITSTSGLTTSGTLHVRRNVSLGNIDWRPTLTSINPRAPPFLSPQAGVDNELIGEGLTMTVPTRAAE